MRSNRTTLVSVALAVCALSIPFASARLVDQSIDSCLCPGKVTGGGWFRCACYGVRSSFGFNIVLYPDWDIPKGELEYQDHTLRLNVHAHDMTWLCVSKDKKTADFGGKCTINHKGGFTFKVHVHDNGEPGKADVFELWLYGLTKYPNYHAVGTPILGGNIQIHKKP